MSNRSETVTKLTVIRDVERCLGCGVDLDEAEYVVVDLDGKKLCDRCDAEREWRT